MKNIFVTVLMASILALSIVPSASAQPVTTTTDIITMERAKEIALTHAGFEETDVTLTKIELDTDDGKQEYEIEFYRGGNEYEYDINATTGEIVGRSIEPI